MKPIILPAIVLLLSACASSGLSVERQAQLAEVAKIAYPDAAKRVPSPGHTTYFVDPAKGDDAHAGTAQGQAWKSFAKINALKLAPGDKVVIAPGVHHETLMPLAEGSAAEPVVIQFLPGVHTFAMAKALRRPWYVSNSSDVPHIPKPCALLVEDAKHVRVVGGGTSGAGKTLLLMGGRMIEIITHRSQDVAYSHFVLDLERPSVSECRVLETTPNTAVMRVADGSTYEVKDGRFAWTGDLGIGWVMCIQSTPANGHAWRVDRWTPFEGAKVTDLGDRRIRLEFAQGNRGLQPGQHFAFRPVGRDTVGVHTARCKDIAFRDCLVHNLTGMGFVSQFTHNMTVERVDVVPPEGSWRTCPAWSDVFQFSNCRGQILVADCRLSGSDDDAINCHGTHLRIVGKPAENQLLLRYMQGQTYGFAPYVAGDAFAVINHGTLREYPGNPRGQVKDCVEKTGSGGKEWLLTLAGKTPDFKQDDVVDNLTWHPDITARGNRVDMASCRGFLLTTRGKVVVEDNRLRSHGPGILIEDDTDNWFESGPVRDMLIRKNAFVDCGITIHAQGRAMDAPVHENIRILDNVFSGACVNQWPFIQAAFVKNLLVSGNRFDGDAKASVKVERCEDVKVE